MDSIDKLEKLSGEKVCFVDVACFVPSLKSFDDLYDTLSCIHKYYMHYAVCLHMPFFTLYSKINDIDSMLIKKSSHFIVWCFMANFFLCIQPQCGNFIANVASCVGNASTFRSFDANLAGNILFCKDVLGMIN